MNRRRRGWRRRARSAWRSTRWDSTTRRRAMRWRRRLPIRDCRPAIRCASAPGRWRTHWRRCSMHGGPMRLHHEPLDVATRFTFRIAHGARSGHANTLVRITHQGIEGLGEASPSHYYGETRGTVEEALRTWAPLLGDDP